MINEPFQNQENQQIKIIHIIDRISELLKHNDIELFNHLNKIKVPLYPFGM
jgi:hypothetical protein